MRTHNFQVFFFAILISAIAVLTFFVFRPFFIIMFLALALVVVFDKAHSVIEKALISKNISAFLSVLLILILIVLPLFLFGLTLFQEASSLYERAQAVTGVPALDVFAIRVESVIQRFFPGKSVEILSYVNIHQYVDQFLSWSINNLGTLFKGLFNVALSLLLLILAMFYFFRDGHKFVDIVKKLSPLVDSYDDKILNRIQIALNSVIRGYLVIAIVQGFLVGLGFFVFGIPNPAIWGFIAAIASFIPTIGTGLVVAPAVVYLFIQGNLFQSIGLALWEVLLVGLIDNILAPLLIHRGVKIHPFLILISVLGGIEMFGPIGFIAGPVLLALLFVLVEIFPMLLHNDTNQPSNLN